MSAALCFEEHGEVLAHWRSQGWQAETVVCLDRHLDLKRIATDDVSRLQAVTSDGALRDLNRDVPFRDDDAHAYGLDDFVYAAGAMGMLRRFIWVTPPSFRPTPTGLAAVLWQMLALVPGHGDEILETFEVESWGAHAQIGELSVVITNMAMLGDVPGLAGARLDIDLDYFCDEKGTVVDDPVAVAEQLRALGLATAAPTMTYSISSGFMPPSLRYLGESFARALGYEAAAAPQTRRHRWESVEAISGRNALSTEAIVGLWDRELSSLGGAGWTARSLLELQSGHIEEALHAEDQARIHGDRATWPAYALGLHLVGAKEYARAQALLERAAQRATDTISAHAHFLRAMCSYRLDELESSAHWAERSVALTPMWRDAHVLAAAVAAKLGDVEQAARHKNNAQLILDRQQGAPA